MAAIVIVLLTILPAACASPTSSPPADPSTASGPAASSPVAQRPSGEITVFAAASLADAFNEIGERFKAANPGAGITFNFGASTQLVAQLDQGARADVFASADQAQMDRAKSAGRIEGAERLFAANHLVVITPARNPRGVRGPGNLSKPGLKLVTSQPDVPIGIYTQAMLDRMSHNAQYGASFKEQVNANVVSREANVRQIVAKVQLGEADAGVVYRSDVTPQLAPQLTSFDIPDEFNTVATYPIAQVKHAPNRAGAEAFIAFVLSPDGQEVLARWNFVPAGAR